MDPFEEFEFKPLTEGLGFHRKETKSEVKKETKINSSSETLLNASLFKNSGFDLLEDEPTLKSPLPRRSTRTEDSRISPSSAAVDDILKTLSQTPAKKTGAATQAKKATQRLTEYSTDVVSFAAFLLDALLILASGLLCMILLLAITRVDLIANITHPDKQGYIYMSTFLVFMGVAFIYYTVNRAFLGYTPGEWAYDQRLGTPADMESAWYVPKCLLRWTVIVLTGVILVPIVSKIIEQDFLGEWLGLPLMRKT